MLWDAPWRAVYRRSTVVSMSLGRRPRRERAWRCWGESAHFDRRAGIIPPPLEPGGAPPWRARRCPTRHNPQVLHALTRHRFRDGFGITQVIFVRLHV